jgi:hypothetical protein
MSISELIEHAEKIENEKKFTKNEVKLLFKLLYKLENFFENKGNTELENLITCIIRNLNFNGIKE